MSDENFGPWIEHDGEPRPELNGRLMRVETEIGQVEVGVMEAASLPAEPGFLCSSLVWASLPPCWWPARIIRYQLHQPRAMQDLIALVETLPTPAPRVTEVA